MDIAGDDSGYVPRLRRAIDGARAANIPVIYVVIALRPGPGDMVVTKRRASAFSGSDLDGVLRTRGIDSLVLTGIATSSVVLCTLCQANGLDFGLTVLSDACLDTDPGVHRVLIECLFPQWADVAMVDDWLKTIAPQ
ncbi:isochorismatase family cysteine hydrolase [Streptomyces sp. NPDC048665]|uniref:cysteine hydrolase family protein n=1 Tax=Streptomyces sp. NPDC048665 TaxID=3155490 RepID=UPI00342748A0